MRKLEHCLQKGSSSQMKRCAKLCFGIVLAGLFARAALKPTTGRALEIAAQFYSCERLTLGGEACLPDLTPPSP